MGRMFWNLLLLFSLRVNGGSREPAAWMERREIRYEVHVLGCGCRRP